MLYHLPNAKIYKITDNTNDNVYYGSTIQNIKSRLRQHKSSCNQGHNISSSQIIKNGDYRIDIVENFPCNTMKELHIREQHYITKNPCVNIQNSYTSPEEKRKQHIMTSRKYYSENKEVALEKKKVQDAIYYQCECGAKYNMSHRARHFATNKHRKFICYKNNLNNNNGRNNENCQEIQS